MKNTRAESTKGRSAFEDWVYENGGPDWFCAKLGINRSTFGHWVVRKTVPSLRLALKIEKLTKGKVSLAQILKDTSPK